MPRSANLVLGALVIAQSIALVIFLVFPSQQQPSQQMRPQPLFEEDNEADNNEQLFSNSSVAAAEQQLQSEQKQQKQQPEEKYYSGIRGVATVLVINLASRPDRRERMRLMLESLGVHPRFVRATDREVLTQLAPDLLPAYEPPAPVGGFWPEVPWAESYELSQRKYNMDLRAIFEAHAEWRTPQDRWKNLAWLGCWNSWVRALSEVCARGGVGLIFEDDVDLNVDFRKHVEHYVATMPPTWQVLKLGGCSWGTGLPMQSNRVSEPDVYKTTGYTCIQALLLKSSAACILRDRVDVAVPKDPVDLILEVAAVRTSPTVSTFLTIPSNVLQDPSARSNIETSGMKGRERLTNSTRIILQALLSFEQPSNTEVVYRK